MNFCIILVIFLSHCMCVYMPVCRGEGVCTSLYRCLCTWRSEEHLGYCFWEIVYLVHLRQGLLDALGFADSSRVAVQLGTTEDVPVSTSSVLRSHKRCHAHCVSLGAENQTQHIYYAHMLYRLSYFSSPGDLLLEPTVPSLLNYLDEFTTFAQGAF